MSARAQELLERIAGAWPSSKDQGLIEHRSVADGSEDTVTNDTLDPSNIPTDSTAFVVQGASNIEMRVWLGGTGTAASGGTCTIKLYGWPKKDPDGNRGRGVFLGEFDLTAGTNNEEQVDDLNPITGATDTGEKYYEVVLDGNSTDTPDNIKAFQANGTGTALRWLFDPHDLDVVKAYVTAVGTSMTCKVGLRRVN